jgi:hypothetical protein
MDGWDALRKELAADPCFAVASDAGRYFVVERFHRGHGTVATRVASVSAARQLIAARRRGHLAAYHPGGRGPAGPGERGH